jgi:nicotinate (nicotinamide) nucleotide adenylyltransferase
VLQALLQTGVFSKILLVPAKQNPLKPTPSKITDEFRLKLIQASLAEIADPRIELWEGELRRSGLSFTRDTLMELSQTNQGELVLIVGNEVFREFPKWKDPNTILRLAHLAIVEREPMKADATVILKQCGVEDASVEPDGIYHHKHSRWIKSFSINALRYSSTELRESLANGWKTNTLNKVPQGIQRSVWLLIKENQLYAVS